jgi:hypothetical protein
LNRRSFGSHTQNIGINHQLALTMRRSIDGLKPKLAHAADNWWKGAQVAAEWDLELILRIRTRAGVCCN